MSITLYPQQNRLRDGIYNSWNSGNRNALAVLPTGGGKTVLLAHIMRNWNGAKCAIAHRQELVGQISLALAREEITHRIIAAKSTVKEIRRQHRVEIGHSQFYNPNAPTMVAGVDTLIRKNDLFEQFKQVTLWIQDEAHHVLAKNKWGKAADLFPNAFGLGVTATPIRADGAGLGRHADGLFDDMVVGEDMRWHIDNNYLTEYTIFVPASSQIEINENEVGYGVNGDFNQTRLRNAYAEQRSQIVGDVVGEYIRRTPDKLGVTFTTDVETAKALAQEYRAKGVSAEALSAKTSDSIRNNMIARFRRGEIKQLVNVDLFGEGFDLPALEVVSMARHTASFAVYAQQFGRALRKMEGKDRAIIIDHVNNVARHNGPPDIPRLWSLDRREKRGKRDEPDDVIPYTSCAECSQPYPQTEKICPWCGHYSPPAARSGPEYVAGDLTELSAEALKKMRHDAAMSFMGSEQKYNNMIGGGYSDQVAQAQAAIARDRKTSQENLRDALSWYGGMSRAAGIPDSESYRRFYFRFGIDILGAQALKKGDAKKLEDKVRGYLPCIK